MGWAGGGGACLAWGDCRLTKKCVIILLLLSSASFCVLSCAGCVCTYVRKRVRTCVRLYVHMYVLALPGGCGPPLWHPRARYSCALFCGLLPRVRRPQGNTKPSGTCLQLRRRIDSADVVALAAAPSTRLRISHTADVVVVVDDDDAVVVVVIVGRL
jgi:hypothetical protein